MPKSKSSRAISPAPHLFLELSFIFILVLSLIGLFIYLTPQPSRGSVAGVTSLNLLSPTPAPVSKLTSLNPVPEPFLTAKAVHIWDPTTNTVLFSKNPHLRLSPASTTKLMTAWISLKEYQPSAVITVKDADRSIGQTANLYAGEQLTVENLLKALLINSGNDAALALAQAHPQGYSYFVELMNQEAANLGLVNTHFTNVSGLEAENHYSSAYDLSLLANRVIQDPLINQIVQTKSTTITDISGTYSHSLENTNKLLWVNNGVNGIKTGWTTNAGECLVTRVVRPEFPLILTLLGSQDRFGETESLINWAYQNYQPE